MLTVCLYLHVKADHQKTLIYYASVYFKDSCLRALNIYIRRIYLNSPLQMVESLKAQA